jgi:hypothetical protein
MLYESGIFSVAAYLPEGQPANLPIRARSARRRRFAKGLSATGLVEFPLWDSRSMGISPNRSTSLPTWTGTR